MNNTLFKHIFSTLIFLAFIPLILTGCGDKNAPNVSGIEVNVTSQRLDKDLYALDTNNLGTGLVNLKKSYPEFLDFYLDTIMGFGINRQYVDSNLAIQKGLLTFLSHKDYRGVFDTVFKYYPDVTEVNNELTKCFQYMKHYYPEYKEPNIIYMITGLNNYGAITYGDHTLAIGLDMFLGADYPFYKSVGIPDYFSRQLNRNYIPVAVMRTLYREKHPFIVEGRTLLDMMIQSGKEMYYTDRMLPFIDEHVQLAYSSEQLKWCNDNEVQVYDFFVRQQLLYETNLQKVVRYVMDGPSATGMPVESPGKIGAWLGLQIVRSYMNEHPEVTLQELIEAPIDAQRFLLESKYKPK